MSAREDNADLLKAPCHVATGAHAHIGCVVLEDLAKLLLHWLWKANLSKTFRKWLRISIFISTRAMYPQVFLSPTNMLLEMSSLEIAFLITACCNASNTQMRALGVVGLVATTYNLPCSSYMICFHTRPRTNPRLRGSPALWSHSQ